MWEGLLGGYVLNLTGDAVDSDTSQGTENPTYPANYLFDPLYDGIYQIWMPVIPTGSTLFNPQNYTNPQIAIVVGGPVIVDFPFVTITPTYSPGTLTPTVPGGGFPTHTPSPTPLSASPTQLPTPTSLLPPPGSTITPGGSLPPGTTITPGGPGIPPGSTITPGGPGVPPGSTITPGGDGVPPGSTITPGGPLPPGTTITPGGPGGCYTLPTPQLNLPPHELCTNVKPLFSAFVSDPNGDNVWARFLSNSYEAFSDTGNFVNPS